VLLIVAACAALQAAERPSIELRNGAFAVEGWVPEAPPSAGWVSVFAVYAGAGDVPPMIGDYTVESGSLTFRPRYAPSPGMRVRAVFKDMERWFETPSSRLSPETRVQQVFPTASTLPENQLKFYIEFSAPMSQGQAWKHMRLLKDDGRPVELPFLEVDQEMWDAESRRLTVLFDPGRIKRGVKPLEDIGPSIESGHGYTLVIDREWQDARGTPLVETHSKQFRVTKADRTPIQTSQWRIGKVRADTRDALVIRFPESLDAALARRLIWVEGVRGKVSLGPEERDWHFVPDQPWAPGPHTLKVDSALEDLAGNKLGRSFDVDTFQRVSRHVERKVMSIPLTAGR
jgi:hypothetical protein